ncbi:hypothetical protein AVEN_220619-1 [Araneus ventricosus]|uniref:Uncharacterized protein n=1 Tax=Araneus ventricosus TaxID=182803 RepID=A0A4Y2GL28_ARAVE|nr:hypothetical protein AVEN_220619-1 [Araneus ventricosus]
MTLCSKYPPSIIYTPLSALKSRVYGLKALYKEDVVPFRITASSNRASNDWTIKAVSDISQEINEDAEFGSEPEKENQTSFRESALTAEDELIPDYEIPVSANRLKILN